MTTYTTADAIINGSDKALHAKMRSALVHIALDIKAEDQATAYHRLRRRWAERVLSQGTGFADAHARMRLAMSGAIRNAYDTDDHTDADVRAVLDAALPDLIAETL